MMQFISDNQLLEPLSTDSKVTLLSEVYTVDCNFAIRKSYIFDDFKPKSAV